MLVNRFEHCREEDEKADVLVWSFSWLEEVQAIEIGRISRDGH